MPMRRSVILVASVLTALSVGLLWADRTLRSAVGPAVESSPRVASAEAQPRIDRSATPRPEKVEPRAEPRRAAINRYRSDDRLLDAFEALRHETAGDALFVARRIEQECHVVTRADFIVGRVLSGRPIQRFDPMPDGSLAATQVLPTREQAEAARELFRRCEGFADRSVEVHAVDADAIEARLLRTDDAVGLAETIAVHRVPATPDRLRTVLASRDPVAITLLDEELAARWQRGSIQPMAASLFGAPSPAMQLVGCDLGLDCGPDSFVALLACLDQASVCGLDVQGQLLTLHPPYDRQRIEDTRTRFVTAITKGDYAIWGL
jgi:hypothetical protein